MGRFVGQNILGSIFSNTRSTLGNMLLLSYVGYLGGLALENADLSRKAFGGVVVFGVIWLVWNITAWLRNVSELTDRWGNWNR